jgi:DNA-binding NtrC family response regulator
LNQDSYEDDDTMNSAHPALQGKRLTVPSQRVTSSSPNLKDEVREIEFRRILEALEQAGGNQTKAAKMLGMSRLTFINRLDEFGIKRPRKGKR